MHNLKKRQKMWFGGKYDASDNLTYGQNSDSYRQTSDHVFPVIENEDNETSAGSRGIWESLTIQGDWGWPGQRQDPTDTSN